MKKRRSPVGLITGVIILLAVAAAYNLNNIRQANMTPEQYAQQQAADAQRKAAAAPAASRIPSQADVLKTVKGKMAPTDSAEGARRAAGGPGGPGSRPTILLPSNKPVKPRPNDSATTSQWFR